MSQENVEIVRRGYEAFDRGDIQTVLSLLDSEIETRVDTALPDWEPRYGRDGFLNALEMWLAPWETYRIELNEVIDAGGRVLVVFREFGRNKGAGHDVEQTAFHLWTFRDGKAVRFDGFFNRSDAFEAAGLSEQDAHAES
jgi:ketosteroid isomerase-like protein